MNEALFRRTNERLESLNEAFSTITDDFDVVCECGDGTCFERILMPKDAYERMRAEATLFVVVPGHSRLAVEAIVEEHPTWQIVQKRVPDAIRIAELTDPRP